MLRRAIPLLFLALAAGVQVNAQSGRPLTEDESVQLGLEQNAQLRSARADAASSRADLRHARSGRLPNVQALANYTRLSGNIPEADFSVPGFDTTFTLLPVELNRYHSEVSVEQPLFSGFRVSNQIRAARHVADAAAMEVQQEEADVAFQIRRAYWRLAQARSVRSAVDASVANVEEYVREVTNRIEAGTALRADVLSAQTRRSEVLLERVEAENAVRVAELELNRLIGEPFDAPVMPTDEPLREALPSLAAMVVRLDEVHPQINALVEQVRALEAQVRATQGAWLPEVAAVGRYVYARPNQYFFLEQDEFRGTWEGGLSLRWNIFDGGRRSAETSGARAQVERARAQLEGLREQVEVELRRQYLEAERAAAAAEVAEQGVAGAEESMRVARRLYSEGAALASQVLDAEQAYRQADAQYARALADREIARAALLNALGQVW